jgi:hypothetical protein
VPRCDVENLRDVFQRDVLGVMLVHKFRDLDGQIALGGIRLDGRARRP